jgi:RNA:NAD 2'-phosphotransferase (TPT1/KptA family)
MRDIYRCGVCKAFTEDRFHCGVEAEPFLGGRRREALSKLMSYILRHEMIRARYGHSKRLGVGISYEVDSQTKVPYHGTSRQGFPEAIVCK